MKIALYGAAGNAGTAIRTELAARGHEVLSIVRNPDRLPAGVDGVQDDLTDVDRAARIISGADVVVSAVAAPMDDTDELVAMIDRLAAAVKQAGNDRFIMVGGCGSLEYTPGVKVLDSEIWPAAYRPLAVSHEKALNLLRGSTLNWTYFSPPVDIFNGERTGTFRLGDDTLLLDPDGLSRVSFQDYAVALVDEIERPAHERARFTIAY